MTIKYQFKDIYLQAVKKYLRVNKKNAGSGEKECDLLREIKENRCMQ